MCTYNGARYLKDQLSSIAAQTLRPTEMIACDDASTDGTATILEAFAAATPFPVRIVQNRERLGVVQNFEQAITLCNGDLIALADQDDVWLAHKLETLTDALNRVDAAYAFCDARLIDADGRETGGRTLLGRRFVLRDIKDKYRQGRELDLLLKRDFIYGTTLMFRAELRDAVLPIPASWSHDTWIVNVLALLGYHGVPVLEPLVRYRRHAGQASGGFQAPVPMPYAARLQAYTDLRARLIELKASATAIARVDEKLRYLQALADIEGTGPIKKAFVATREVLSGRWARYSPRTLR